MNFWRVFDDYFDNSEGKRTMVWKRSQMEGVSEMSSATPAAAPKQCEEVETNSYHHLHPDAYEGGGRAQDRSPPLHVSVRDSYCSLFEHFVGCFHKLHSSFSFPPFLYISRYWRRQWEYMSHEHTPSPHYQPQFRQLGGTIADTILFENRYHNVHHSTSLQKVDDSLSCLSSLE